MPLRIPEFEVEYLDETMVQNLQFSQEFPLEPFFVSRAYKGTNWWHEIERVASTRGSAKVRSAPTQDVGRDAAGWLKASPFHYGEAYPFDQDDLDILAEVGESATPERARVVRKGVRTLTGRFRQWRHWLFSQLLSSGELHVNENGVKVDIDFGVGRLNVAPASDPLNYRLPKPWSDSTAKIITDLAKLKKAFHKKCGRYPDVIFYHPDLEDSLIGNADVEKWLGLFRRETAERFFANREQTFFRGLGFDFAGMIWVPVKHVFEDSVLGAKNEAWDVNTLTFATIRGKTGTEPLFEFKKAKTVETNMTGGPVLDVYESVEPKGLTRLRQHANGIPTINIEDHLMVLENVMDAG